jgi:hypothetical protein
MVTVVKAGDTAKDLFGNTYTESQTKKLDTRKHLGKVKWNEDAVEFQNRQRETWDESTS